MILHGEPIGNSDGEIKVSFGYHCNSDSNSSWDRPNYIDIPSSSGGLRRANSSFSCLSGAALSANATLANTNICNGLIASEILPTLDSPNSFRRIPSLTKMDLLSSSLQSGMSILSNSPSSPDNDSFSLKSMSAPSRSESFLNAMELQIAGGAAGEDRVQAVCSEENGWLFCGIYDGFNGRDAADFLAGTLYETITSHLNLLDWDLEQDCSSTGNVTERVSVTSFKQSVLSSLQHALNQAENEFLHMVEQEMDDRPDLVSIGSCVLLLLHGKNLYLLNLGDSRAVLATYDRGTETKHGERLRAVQLTDSHTVDNEDERIRVLSEHPDDPSTLVGGKVKGKLKVSRAFGVGYLKRKDMNDASYDRGTETKHGERLRAVQLTDSHTVDNEDERIRVLSEHPDDPSTLVGGKVKGKLKVSRAFGVGYLKRKDMNDALMGILRVRNLVSPPYVSVQPSLIAHEVSDSDHFVVLGSDGLFDFFTNNEVVNLVHSYMLRIPSGDPAKFLVEQLAARAADSAGFSMEELMSIPAGRRRKYHDDVTVIVIVLGTNKRTSKASTCL